MPFVLDASIAACWALEDERHEMAEAALSRLGGDEAVVPALWWFEVRNILVVNERRKRIDEARSSAFLRFLNALPIRLDRDPDETRVLHLARKHRLSVYDASYLELALRDSLPLATLDADLSSAACAEGASIVSARNPR